MTTLVYPNRPKLLGLKPGKILPFFCEATTWLANVTFTVSRPAFTRSWFFHAQFGFKLLYLPYFLWRSVQYCIFRLLKGCYNGSFIPRQLPKPILLLKFTVAPSLSRFLMTGLVWCIHLMTVSSSAQYLKLDLGNSPRGANGNQTCS